MRMTRGLLAFLRPYRLWALLAPLLMALEVAMDLQQPRLIQRIIDQGIASRDVGLILDTGLWMLGLALVGAVGGVGCTFFSTLAAQGFGADLRDALFRKVQSLSFGNLDRLETGRLITRLTNDVTQVQEVVLISLRMMVRSPLLLVGSLVMAVLTSPDLALIFVVLIPALLAVAVWVVNRTFPLFGRVQERLDALNTVLQENLAGARVVKAFVRADQESARFGEANERLVARSITALRTAAVTMPAVGMLLNLGVVAALWFGGYRVVSGELRVGQLVAFVNYLTQALMSLMMVSMMAVRVSRAEASAARVNEVLVAEPETPPATSGSTAQPRGRVAFEGVTFSYSRDGSDPVLRDVSLDVAPGQTVALLGATGSGKSSLVSLVGRFYDATAGRVTIDGVDVREIDEATLRRTVGVALQETVLFSGTVRDNIRYGRPDATDDEVIAAARAARAHDFIASFPDGYDSIVGQRGVNLSGGQKQRIAIARALLVQPTVLILDDSTSAVDVETEARIQAALAESREGRTSFVVAQRISTVLSADRILVLDDGQIVAAGNHRDLLSTSPLYREIYESQLEGGAGGQSKPARSNGTLATAHESGAYDGRE